MESDRCIKAVSVEPQRAGINEKELGCELCHEYGMYPESESGDEGWSFITIVQRELTRGVAVTPPCEQHSVCVVLTPESSTLST